MSSFFLHKSTFSELGAPPDTSSSHGFVTNQDLKRLGTKRSFTIVFAHPRARSHHIGRTAFLNNCHDSYVVVCLTPNKTSHLHIDPPRSTEHPSPKPFFCLPLSTFFCCCCDGNWSDDWSFTRGGMFFVAMFLLQVPEMTILFSIIEYLRGSPFRTTVSWMYRATSSVSCSHMAS